MPLGMRVVADYLYACRTPYVAMMCDASPLNQAVIDVLAAPSGQPTALGSLGVESENRG
jgi:hypothetical protein